MLKETYQRSLPIVVGSSFAALKMKTGLMLMYGAFLKYCNTSRNFRAM